MYDAYIARTKNGLVYAFYFSPGNGLCQRVYSGGRWGGAVSLAIEAVAGFNVGYGADGLFYVLYRDNGKTLRLLAGNKDGYSPLDFEEKPMASPQVVASDKGRYIISEEDIQNLEKTLECAFRLQIIKDDHAILYYSEPGGFGYRELNMTKTAEFRPVHIGGGFQRFSALASEENVHFLYTIKILTGSRLLYRKRHKAGLSAAVTVADGGRIDGCWLFIVKKRIYAAYMMNKSLYISVSEDDGNSFVRPARYRSKLCEMPVKAAYLSALPYDEEGLAVREVLVDGLNPWDVQILPEIYPDFYPEGGSPVVKENIPEGDTDVEGLKRQLTQKDRQLAFLQSELDKQGMIIEKMFNP